jgi:hypothetical protein
MDVTFREDKPYYGTTNDTRIALFVPEVQQEGDINNGGTHVGTILVPTSGASHYPSKDEEIIDTSGGNNSIILLMKTHKMQLEIH